MSVLFVARMARWDLLRKSRAASGVLTFRDFLESELGLSSVRSGELLVEHGLEAPETPAAEFPATGAAEEEAPDTPAPTSKIPESVLSFARSAIFSRQQLGPKAKARPSSSSTAPVPVSGSEEEVELEAPSEPSSSNVAVPAPKTRLADRCRSPSRPTSVRRIAAKASLCPVARGI